MHPAASRLRHVIFTFSAVAALAAVAAPARGQEVAGPPTGRPVAALGPDAAAAVDPSELFLRAFTSVQQAETAERDGKLKLAMSKYRFAATLLDQINQNHPNWQPLIVGYRSRKTSEAITKLQTKIDVQAPASAPVAPADLPPAPPPPAGPGAGGSNSANSANSGDYFALPEPDRAGGGGNATAGGRRAADAASNNAPAAPDARASARAEAAVNKAAQEARAKIDRLQDELKNTRKQLDAAQRERESAQKERETARKEQRRLKDQLEEAQDDLKTAVKKVEQTKTDRDSLAADREKLQARLKEAGVKNAEAAAATRKELRQEIEKLSDRLTKADEVAKDASRERDALAAKYAAATKKNAAGTRGELPKEVNDRLETLAAENTTLTQKLATAERTIADLNVEAAKRKGEAEAVQGELTKLRQQLAESRDKNDQADTQLVALRKQLDEGAERMKEGLPKEEANKLAKENELLRNISLRLLKQQNVRAQASKLLGEELVRLEVQSKNVTDQLAVLGQPSVQLTDEERTLFKDPLVAISDNADPSTLAASIVAVSPARGGDGAPTGAASTSGNGNLPPPPPGASSPSPEAGAASAATAGSPSLPGTAPTPAPNPPVPENLIPLAREAKEQLDQGRFPEAEASYEKLVARAPKSVYGLANLGVVLSRQGKLKSAETKLKKAVALAPNDPFSQATLGIVYYQMRRFDDAIECLTRAIALDPKTASAHNYLGITSFQKGWPEAAVEELDKALALRPDYADAHFNLAVVYALNQPPSKEKAMQHYKRATELGAAPDPALEKMIN